MIRSVIPIDRYFADRFDEIRKRFATDRMKAFERHIYIYTTPACRAK